MKATLETETEKRITTEQTIEEIKALSGARHLTTRGLLSWSHSTKKQTLFPKY